MKIKLDMKEFTDFEKRLRELPNNVGKNYLHNSAVSAIRTGAKEIRAAAPVGEVKSPMSERYGPLNKNIKVTKVKRVDGIDQVSAKITTGNAFWAYINLILGNRYTAAAQNWFEDAFESVSDKMSSEIFAQANKRIDKYWSKK